MGGHGSIGMDGSSAEVNKSRRIARWDDDFVMEGDGGGMGD